MLKFLKRLAGVEAPQPEPVRRRRRRKGEAESRFDTAPGVLPEVTEGSGESDWELWQDSVAASELGGLTPTPRQSRFESSQFASSVFAQSQFMDTQPSELADLDPFGKVTKNRDV